jgi:hypothetical protein
MTVQILIHTDNEPTALEKMTPHSFIFRRNYKWLQNSSRSGGASLINASCMAMTLTCEHVQVPERQSYNFYLPPEEMPEHASLLTAAGDDVRFQFRRTRYSFE